VARQVVIDREGARLRARDEAWRSVWLFLGAASVLGLCVGGYLWYSRSLSASDASVDDAQGVASAAKSTAAAGDGQGVSASQADAGGYTKRTQVIGLPQSPEAIRQAKSAREMAAEQNEEPGSLFDDPEKTKSSAPITE